MDSNGGLIKSGCEFIREEKIKRDMRLLPSYSSHSKNLFAITAFFGFSMAILVFMITPYLREIFLTDNVGAVYIFPEVIVLALFSWFLRWVIRVGKATVLFTLVLLQIILLSMLVYFEGTAFTAILIVGHFALLPFLVILLDMFLEAHSKDENAGRARGLFIFFANVGFFLGPIVGGFLVDRYGFSSIFFVATLCYVIIFLLALSKYLSEGNSEIRQEVSLMAWTWKVWKDENIRRMYIVSLLLEGFYTVSFITFPILLLNAGLTLSQAGIIFTVMLLPFLFVAYPAGHLADTRWGEKEILVVAMVLLGVILLVISRISVGGMWLWMGIFLGTRIGTALAETMRDTYFYRRVGKDDVALISFFRMARSLGTLFFAGLTFLFLFFGGTYGELFVFFSVCFFLGAILTLSIQDSDPRGRVN